MINAASSRVRAKTPTWSRIRDNTRTPEREILPCVGLKPMIPQKDAGLMTDPLVCEPIANGTIPAATAAAFGMVAWAWGFLTQLCFGLFFIMKGGLALREVIELEKKSEEELKNLS